MVVVWTAKIATKETYTVKIAQCMNMTKRE